MITLQPAHARVLGVLGDRVGLAVRGHHPHLAADPALGQLLRRPSPSSPCRSWSPSRCRPAARRPSSSLERAARLGLRLGCVADLARSCSPRSTARSAMSRRICRPSNSIMSAAAYAASRAAAASAPSAVTLSTRPPAVTIAPSRARAVPACVTSTPSGTRRARRSGRRCDERRRVAGAGEHDASRPSAGDHCSVDAGAARRARRRARAASSRSRAQPRQHRLGLGVAEADVELEHPRPVGGQHQAGVEDARGTAMPRRAARRRPAGGRCAHELAPRASRRRRAPASRSPCRRCWARASPSKIRL